MERGGAATGASGGTFFFCSWSLQFPLLYGKEESEGESEMEIEGRARQTL